MPLPGKQECFYILEMLEAGLIDFHHTQPWGHRLILEADTAPAWLCALATVKDQGDQKQALRDYVLSEPFEPWPAELEKFHVACLWLRYERRELSWASFLREAGRHLDAADSEWPCETLFQMLNDHEAANCAPESEAIGRQRLLALHALEPWIDRARQHFEPLRQWRQRA